MPKSDEFVLLIGPLSVLRAGRVWNIELFGLHLYGIGWMILGGGLVQ